jgi:aspartyl-tRNA(Asn)/glutamyl-tRNA(Gln) amidotransferase subunit C
MLLSERDVEKIAHLARLELNEREKRLYLGQLRAILEYAAVLNEPDLSGISPTTHAIAQENVA